MKKRLLRMMLSILYIVLGVYLGFGILIFLMQSKFIFFPDKRITLTPSDLRIKYEDLNLENPDGTTLNLWYLPYENAKRTAIFCHGNGGNMSYNLDAVELLHGLGLNVATFDYRGYGNSKGSPSEKGVYADAERAYRFLVDEKKVEESSIIIVGRSLGASIAANLAKNHSPAGLILESGFSSVPDVAAGQYPIYPVRLMCRFKMPTAEYVTQVKCPVLVVHSPDDEIIPFSHGKRIFDAANSPKTFLEITGSHNEGFSDSIDTYKPGLEKFLKGLE